MVFGLGDLKIACSKDGTFLQEMKLSGLGHNYHVIKTNKSH